MANSTVIETLEARIGAGTIQKADPAIADLPVQEITKEAAISTLDRLLAKAAAVPELETAILMVGLADLFLVARREGADCVRKLAEQLRERAVVRPEAVKAIAAADTKKK